MNTNKKLNKMILITIMLISLFLIMSVSFAAENDMINRNETNIISTENEAVLENNDDSSILAESSKIYINSENGNDDNDGSIDKPIKTIQKGISMVDSSGTIYLTGNFNGTGNSALTLSKSINFIGIGTAVIDGKSTTKFATLSSGTYTFTNVSFVNNYATGGDRVFGGAFSIASSATATFNVCKFENNSVFGISRGNGGAIDNEGTLFINDCLFIGNSVNISDSASNRKNAADGGAISNLGKLTINNTKFISNRALRNGGAIRAQDSGFLKVYNSSFIDNAAQLHLKGGCYGGAIYIWGVDIEVYDTLFKNNYVNDPQGNAAQGGAVSIDRNQKVTFIGCNFINNTATAPRNVFGQSLYIATGTIAVNYCTIDTPLYVAPTSANLKNNWWGKNNLTGVVNLATLPSDYAVFNVTSNYIGQNTWEIIGILTWNNGTTENIDKINLNNAVLSSQYGSFSEINPVFKNGQFKVNYTSTESKNIVTAQLNNEFKNLTFINVDVLIDVNDIIVGDLVNVTVTIQANINGTANITINNKVQSFKTSDKIIYYTFDELLQIGTYEVKVVFIDSENNLYGYNSTSFSVKNNVINTNLTAENLVIFTGDDAVFKAFLKDENGNPISGKVLLFLINDVIYNDTTDNEGAASININLAQPNLYDIFVKFDGDSDYNASSAQNTIDVNSKQRIDQIKDLTKDYGDSNGFSVRALDKYGNAAPNQIVKMTINTVTYNVKTDSKGIATLPIRLKPGNFKITVDYDGQTVSKTVKVKNVLFAKNKKVKRASSYKYNAVLKNSAGKFIKGKLIKFTIRGKTYKAYTNAKGQAKITIKGLKVGKNIVRVKYNDLEIKKLIKVVK